MTGVVSPLTIRLGTVILYTGSLYLLYLTGVRLFGIKAARLTLAIASIIPIFQIAFGILTLPDGPLIFFWTASLYCAAWEFFPTSSYSPSYRLGILGILVGLACLGKYHGFILGLGILGFVVFSPVHRRLLLSAWSWLAIALFGLTLFPILFWNLNHDWISFRFHLSSRFIPAPGVTPPGYSLVKVLVVFLTNILYLFPSFGIPLHWAILRSWRLQFQQPQKDLQENLILWVSLPLILGFTFLGGSQQILAAWPMAGFWSATLILGKYAVKWDQSLVRRWLKYSLISIVTLMVIFLSHLHLGILQKPSQYALFGGFLTLEQDNSTEMFPLQQLRDGFTQSSELSQALAEADFVFTNAYYLAGQIDMALTPLRSLPVTTLSDDMRGFAFWFDPEDWVGKNALYITKESYAQMVALTQVYSSYFAEFREIGTIPIKRGGEITEVFHVYQAQEMLRPYPIGLR
ncbi:PMT family glycosyltransferase, 4-amino-4-deoxy-L-arabinose transferase [Gloeocapsa sp. PCC 73106]|nr:PMT family glycosyltransferase, 4-amino-4-deoxy-L-arabinose transferase [Gloeocapsa sp. PCC 73106]